MEQRKLNTVEEVLEDFRQGKVVIVVDDEDRENEGDFIVAAEKITPEIVNFMLHNGRGVLCAPLTEDRCRELDLDMMVGNNTSLLGTPFTVTDVLRVCRYTTGLLPFALWWTRTPSLRISADRDTSIRCVHATREY